VIKRGRIVTKTDRGFGFIVSQDSEQHIFFHSAELAGIMFDELQLGDEVVFSKYKSIRGETAYGVVPLNLFDSGSVALGILGILGIYNELTRKVRKDGSNRRKLRCFICHASEDKPQSRKLFDSLAEIGIEPWLDEENLLPGQDWDLEIRNAIRKSDVVVVVLSTRSITKSGYVQKELKYALGVADEQPEGAIFLIPVKTEPCQTPDRLAKLHYLELYREDGFRYLALALEAKAASLGLT
jgi:cold shock CspA family protein